MLNDEGNEMISPSKTEKKEDLGADIRKTKKVREIVQLLAKTSSQMKIFASDHSNIQKFADELYGKMNDYLEKHWKLEIGVKEFEFTFQEKSIYTDDQIKRSLPFLFFKDGVQALFFYKGLGKEEFVNFLDIIKRESALPAEESDIVISLWEKDFTNIRYAASDEFLESKIGVGMESLEYRVDLASLTTGKIELTPADKEALARITGSGTAASDSNNRTREASAEITEEDITAFSHSLSDEEIEVLEEMLDSNRRITVEDELIALIMEMLYLEEREEPFAETIKALGQCHDELLEKGNYSRAKELLYLVLELKNTLTSKSDPRVNAMDSFLERIKNDEAIARLQKNVQEEDISNTRALLEYLRILGSVSIPVISQLYDLEYSPQIRTDMINILKELGTEDTLSLMRIAQDDKPGITKAIISVVSDSDDRRAIQHLAAFINYKNKSIKFEAIRALGKHNDETANRILMAFLKDEEEEIRVLAAQNLAYVRDDSVATHIIDTVKDKNFRKKSTEEIRAFIELLGRIKTEQSRSILRTFLKKPGLFAGTKMTDISLQAISSLERMGTKESTKILEEGTRFHNKTIKEACKNSLQRLSNRTLNPGVKE
jgi:HEAT repeat protein